MSPIKRTLIGAGVGIGIFILAYLSDGARFDLDGWAAIVIFGTMFGVPGAWLIFLLVAGYKVLSRRFTEGDTHKRLIQAEELHAKGLLSEDEFNKRVARLKSRLD